jgi:hypothetical protein
VHQSCLQSESVLKAVFWIGERVKGMRLMKRWLFVVTFVVAAPTLSLADVHSFPSNDSTVVANGGFLGSEQIGYFWSVARGDRVTETFADSLTSVNRAIFDFGVPTNVLYSTPLQWDVKINSTTVGNFQIDAGFTGNRHLDFDFAPIVNIGGQYTVSYVVTNEIPSGWGSHTLAYAGEWPHSVELLNTVPLPAGVLLAGLGLSVAGILHRRKTT